jgi:hypothetical protein
MKALLFLSAHREASARRIENLNIAIRERQGVSRQMTSRCNDLWMKDLSADIQLSLV